MRNPLILAILTMSAVAFAGGYAAITETQTGTGTNGMTYLPDGGGDGVASPTGTFGGAFQNYYARLAISPTAGAFQNATDLSWMRSQRFGPNPDGGACVWNRMPAFDVEVDGGQSGKIVGISPMSWYISLPSPVGATSCAERWLWTGENTQQATTLDAGISVSVELYGYP